MKKILIVAGEASGDLHGANLSRELIKQDESLVLFGVGSVRMKEAAVRMLADASEISVVGITAVITHFPAIYRVYTKLKRFLASERPDLVILIDFPDFNIMLGKAARRLGIPVLYYISPQIWAWRKGRIRTIASLVRAMIVVFPFEVPLYEKAGVDVRFAGHPLMDIVRSDHTVEQARISLGLDPARRTVALLPGSRKSEVAYLLTDMLKAAQLLLSRFPGLQFVLPLAPTLDHEAIRRVIESHGIKVHLVNGRVYDALRASDAAIVASGTATLETGIMNIPMVIVYRISALNYFILTKLIRGVRDVGLVNIVAGRRIVPELVQQDSTPEKMADAVTKMLSDAEYSRQIRNDLADMRSSLGEAGASARAASVVRELLAEVG